MSQVFRSGKSTWEVQKGVLEVKVIGRYPGKGRLVLEGPVVDVVREKPHTFVSIDAAIAHYKTLNSRTGGFEPLLAGLEQIR